MVNCPKCKSNDVDLSSIGLPNAVQCLDCGHLFADTSWPFPTSLVNKPLNDIPVKIDGLKDAQEAPL
jgi:ribosomal protein L37AE/L43A